MRYAPSVPVLVLIAVTALWVFPEYWLLGLFAALCATLAGAEHGIATGLASGAAALVAGLAFIVVRRAIKSGWEVERDRWDRRDFHDSTP